MTINDLREKGYKEVEKTLTTLKANIFGAIVTIPIVVLAFMVFYTVRREKGMTDVNLITVIIVTGLLIVVHELIHGGTWVIFCKDGWKSIKFGVEWKYLTPYCHCKEILEINRYRLGTIMPLIITGIIPYIISLTLGNTTLLLIAVVMISGAAGDIIMFILLLNEKRGTLVMDHPTTVGCILYRPENNRERNNEEKEGTNTESNEGTGVEDITSNNV